MSPAPACLLPKSALVPKPLARSRGKSGLGRRRRIDGLTADQHLEVQVRPGRPARITGLADHLPACHRVAGPDELLRQVRVARLTPVAVVDDDGVAVA